jgi:transposase-like protein
VVWRKNRDKRINTDTINGIFPNEASITRPIGAVLFEQNDEWQIQHRYMQVEAFSQIDAAQTDPILSIRTQAA